MTDKLPVIEKSFDPFFRSPVVCFPAPEVIDGRQSYLNDASHGNGQKINSRRPSYLRLTQDDK